jgi:cytochrome c peroxidase
MKKAIIIGTVACASLIYSCTQTNLSGSNPLKSPTLPLEKAKYTESVLPNGVKLSALKSNVINQNIVQNAALFANTLDVTDDGATLGRVLFYDTRLSLNNTVSCGSCHHQDKAFTDGTAVSRGFEGRITHRSSMAFANPILSRELFWDSRSTSLEDLALRPVQNHIEMGMTDMKDLIAKLSATDFYPELFKNAYGSAEITQERVANAMSQFVGSIVTSDSKFDRASAEGTPFESLSLMESNGHAIFQQSCASCHAISSRVSPVLQEGPSDTYSGGSITNNNGTIISTNSAKGTTNIGLDLSYVDNGLKDGRFKIPSLRNIALTAPYMHDGRFNNLMEVLNHYSNGIKPHKNLDPKFINPNGTVKFIKLSESDKFALIAFLNTLTDKTMTSDPKFSNPFN